LNPFFIFSLASGLMRILLCCVSCPSPIISYTILPLIVYKSSYYGVIYALPLHHHFKPPLPQINP
ncbi:MAG TPA: hypothetical protein PKJ97_03505, partial [Candidatus Bilamarchaeaceae archaeon]|nr:hypothetical protein [Candidatus Bilamarchaeaceae archaeon]